MNPLVILGVLILAGLGLWWADEQSTAPGWVRWPIMIVCGVILLGFFGITQEDGSPYP